MVSPGVEAAGRNFDVLKFPLFLSLTIFFSLINHPPVTLLVNVCLYILFVSLAVKKTQLSFRYE
jgi:hypothetical protein